MSDAYFVFVVYDPHQTSTPIWVGAGTGDACNTFLGQTHPRNPVLDRTLREYRAEKLKPKAKIVKRFATRPEALVLKRSLIHKYGRSDNGTGTLLNLIGKGYAVQLWRTHPTFLAIRKRRAERLAAAKGLSLED